MKEEDDEETLTEESDELDSDDDDEEKSNKKETLPMKLIKSPIASNRTSIMLPGFQDSVWPG